MYNLKPLHKRLTVTHASGFYVRPDSREPVEFKADIQGSYKPSTAEKLLRRETMDVSIVVIDTDVETVDYVIDPDEFVKVAKVIDKD